MALGLDEAQAIAALKYFEVLPRRYSAWFPYAFVSIKNELRDEAKKEKEIEGLFANSLYREDRAITTHTPLDDRILHELWLRVDEIFEDVQAHCPRQEELLRLLCSGAKASEVRAAMDLSVEAYKSLRRRAIRSFLRAWAERFGDPPDLSDLSPGYEGVGERRSEDEIDWSYFEIEESPVLI